MLDEIVRYIAQNQVAGALLGASAIGSLTYAVKGLPAKLRPLLEECFITTVEAYSEDPAYAWLMQWFGTTGYGDRCKRLFVSAFANAGAGAATDGPPSMAMGSAHAPAYLFPARGWHLFRRGRNLFAVTIAEDRASSGRPREMLRIKVFGTGREKALAFIEEARAIAMREHAGRINVFTNNESWWTSCGTRPGRLLDTVILRNGQRERIFKDLQCFITNEDWWQYRGLPYRRGYLFEGPPGCGKSSLVTALAAAFGLDIYSLSLSGARSDADLLSLMSQCARRSILLIEDVDAAFSDRKQTQGVTGITFAGLLNAIDGATAAEGQILVMTSNHPERLDPALIRPGRVDVREELDLPDAEQAAAMHRLFFPMSHPDEDAAFGADWDGKSAAQIQQELVRLSR